MKKLELHKNDRPLEPRQPSPSEEITALRTEKERYAKLLVQLRDTLIHVKNAISDEGDRVFFGSTNDADRLKAIIEQLDDLAWDRIMNDAGYR